MFRGVRSRKRWSVGGNYGDGECERGTGSDATCRSARGVRREGENFLPVGAMLAGWVVVVLISHPLSLGLVSADVSHIRALRAPRLRDVVVVFFILSRFCPLSPAGAAAAADSHGTDEGPSGGTRLLKKGGCNSTPYFLTSDPVPAEQQTAASLFILEYCFVR